MVDLLARHGYEPELRSDDAPTTDTDPTSGSEVRCPAGEVILTNCPFHRLAEEHRALVCGMNRDFLAGVVDGIEPDPGERRLAVRLAPEEGYCCVRVTRR